MGTNYYIKKDFCPCCGKPRQELHIGKASYGWRFLAYIPTQIKSFDDYVHLLSTGLIFDEYGTQKSKEDILEIIMEHCKDCEQANAGHFVLCDYTREDFS